MKKIVMLLCASLFTTSFATKEEVQTEEYEVQLEQEEADGSKTRFPPVIINITVSNISDARSNNQATVTQKQELIQETKNEPESYRRSSWDSKYLALALALYVATEDESENPWGATW